GFGFIIWGALLEQEKYQVIKKEYLLLDAQVLKELMDQYARMKRRWYPLVAMGMLLMVSGGFPFLMVRRGFLNSLVIEGYTPIFILAIAIGVGILILGVSNLESFRILANNGQYTSGVIFKVSQKIREKIGRI
ncbi:MAG: hypothetical protein ACRC5C_00375, partial [Bacilli bacterium]